MKIGEIYKFDYNSSSPEKEKENPVKIALTDEKVASIKIDIAGYADKSEKEFEELTSVLKENNFFDNIKKLKELDDIRKAKSARARKTEEQKNLEVLIEGQYEGFIKKFKSDDEPKKKNKTITDLFFRAYKPENMAVKDDGYHEAILVSKSYTKTGNVLYKFIALNPMTVEQSDLLGLDGFKYID